MTSLVRVSTLTLLAAALVGAAAGPVRAQAAASGQAAAAPAGRPVEQLFADASAKELAVRKALAARDPQETLLRAVRTVVSDYENVVRRYPTSSYCDDALWRAGINAFRAYRAEESPKPQRFPVFMRREYDHRGHDRALIHDQAELDAAVAQIATAAVGIRADVSQLSDLDKVYAQIAKDEGRLDILFANAGGGDMLPLGAITEEQFDRIFATNVRGVLFTVQKALPLLSAGSSIILTGSTVSIKGTANFSVYSASKAAVRNFARSWALDLQGRGIRVNVVSPGPIKTPGLGDLVPEEHRQGLYDALAAQVPLGRLGAPGEVGKAVAFLASDAASFINATELFVDGGMAQI